jgi:hypothetical protein
MSEGRRVLFDKHPIGSATDLECQMTLTIDGAFDHGVDLSAG